MAKKIDLQTWTIEALQARGGSATIVDVCKYVWQHHEDELRQSGDLFYTWQYDIRWAAKELRDQKIMKPDETSPKGLWELVPAATTTAQ